MLKNNLKYFWSIVLFWFLNGHAYGTDQQKNTRQQYIDQFAKLAIQEMNEFHIPASITMAQACLESRDGNSPLAVDANNHFGIKCNSSWTGPSVRQDDDSKNECFRKYKTAIESFRDHSKFLTGSTRYTFLFDYDIKDYKKWAYGLKKAGYATDPQYPERLLKIINDFQLNQLDEYYNSKKNYAIPEKREVAYIGGSKRKSNRGIDNFSINPYQTRNVERRNGAKAFVAKEGDTYEQITMEFSLKEWEIFKYNDAQKGDKLSKGDIIYLQTKSGSAPRGNDIHVLKKGETLWDVAQWYGVRLNALYRKNRMTRGEEPVVGQNISLRKKVRK